jgi:two-component system sensor histidine kinase KdpD
MIGRGSRTLASLVAVVGITWLGYNVIPVNATTIGFAYLLLVLALAGAWGFTEAAASAILATLFFNYFFLDPRLTFTIADHQNWVALVAFLATALMAGRLSTKARQRTLDAIERQQALERLYTFGRAILLMDDSEPLAKQLARRLAETFDLSAAALYERRSGTIYRAGPLDFDGMDAQLHESALQGTAFADPERRRVITAVRLGAQPIASLALQGARLSDSVLQSISNLVAIGLERSRVQELAHEVEAAKHSERLRTTILDALAHEFKTPLTSIRAATSALLSNPEQRPPGDTRMLRIADEEAAHLQELMDNALDMAQLDTDHLDVKLETANLNDLIGAAVRSFSGKSDDHALEFVPDHDLPSIAMDRRLIGIALKQILDNALKYSPSGMPVTVRAFRTNGTVALEITDRGGGISEQEQGRIFDRFYRGPSIRDQIPGSGLGLSIAHRILQAHNGEISVKSHPGETTFRLVLPLERRKGELGERGPNSGHR